MADELRKYATAAVVPIKLLLADGSGFATSGDWTPGAGDVKYSKSTDALAFGTDTNAAGLPTFSNDWWLFAFTTGELTSKITAVSVVNAALSSDAFTIETFGHASAMYQGDFSAADQAFPTNFAATSISAGGVVDGNVVSGAGNYGIKKNTALANFSIYMTDSTLHTAKTGATVAVQRSIDGGAFANCTNTPATEVASGEYKISLSAADLNGDVIMIKATGTGCDQRMISIITSP